MPASHLTKSTFVDGLRCRRLLWLKRYRSDLAAAPDASQARRLRQGSEVGAKAREGYPGGRHIGGGPVAPDRAKRETREALASDAADRAPALFEACFEADGVRVFVDILERDFDSSDRWNLVEVKASSKVKRPHQLQDVAVQAHVLRRSGVKLSRAFVQHLNTAYVPPGPGELFTRVDVTDDLTEIDVPAALERLRATIEASGEPDVAIGSHCKNPHACPFKAHCWEPYGRETIFHLPKRIHHTRRNELAAKGQIRIEDLRDVQLLTETERDAVEWLRNREVRIDRDGLRQRLAQLRFPVHFLDFEAIDYAIPRFPGTHPYQHVPFQFSCHVLHEDGQVEHCEYLHEGADDPRPALADGLLEALNEHGSIVAYNVSYERRCMRELAEFLPDRADALEAAIARLWDQEPIFRSDWVDYRFEGRSSIKVVLPVLCPELSYDGMAVASGSEAMAAWDAAAHGDDPHGDDPHAERTFAVLRAYCEQDTWAMVRIHERLVEEAGRADSG